MKKLKEILRKLSLRTHSWIAATTVLIGCLLMWIGAESGEAYLWIFIVGLIFVIIALAYSFIVFRCPHCDSLLGTRTIPKHCPHCGKELE